MRVEVLELFGHATLQDAGRPGFRRFGVPPGGAFDGESLRLANGLLDNEPFAPAVEFAVGTMRLKCIDYGNIAVVGACPGLVINGAERSSNSRLALRPGDEVTLLPPRKGLRTYVALPGGVEAERVLGSASGLPVARGDVLAGSAGSPPDMLEESLVAPPSSLAGGGLRVVPMVPEEGWCHNRYTASNDMDRVGIRLEGPKPETDARSGESEPSVFGAIQLTEGCRLIIHGPDGPTIGGYVKLGVVIRADLDRLAQVRPGDTVEFEPVSLAAARLAAGSGA